MSDCRIYLRELTNVFSIPKTRLGLRMIGAKNLDKLLADWPEHRDQELGH